MRMVVLSKVYCDQEGCENCFELELVAKPASYNVANSTTIEFPREGLPAPEGWYVHNHMVLCSKHNVFGKRKLPPTDVVLKRARDLQALAMDKSAADNERSVAWKEFGKLWNQYELPPELGLEGYGE